MSNDRTASFQNDVPTIVEDFDGENRDSQDTGRSAAGGLNINITESNTDIR